MSKEIIEIKIDPLEDEGVINLLKEHLKDMYANSPAKSVHALDIKALKDPSITFWSASNNTEVLACIALKELDSKHAEIKSMRTSLNAKNKGIATKLLLHVIEISKQRKYEKISLETGSIEFFKPARNLYEKHGFSYCEPFANYTIDENSKYMNLNLNGL